ncbi:MAG TPA: helix-turn-helix domain-containing protein [Acidobacteriota bacterium]|nr:helix-turn-helix domain-containing protein [Acidobacteriota bacterium]
MSELHTKLGRLLQLERQRQEIDLNDLSDELKISIHNLEAIESGDVAGLPSDLYFNLFAKSYAERLGIDYTRTVEAITMDLKESPAGSDEAAEAATDSAADGEVNAADQAEVAAAEAGSAFGKRVIAMVVAAIVVLAAFLVVYEVFLKSPAMEGERTTASDNAPGSASEDDSPGSVAAAYTRYEWNVPAYEKPTGLTLTLTARDESWATVVADGDTVVYRNLVPWREYQLEAKYRFLVSVGIPSRVETKLNGQVVNLRDPETGRISRSEINQTNAASILTRPIAAPEAVRPPMRRQDAVRTQEADSTGASPEQRTPDSL